MKKALILLALIAGNCYAQTEVYKDSSGAIVGRSNVVNGATVYTDSSGLIVGKAEMINGQTVYKDSSGLVTGTATQSAPIYGAPVPPRGPLRPLPLPKGVYPWMLD